MWISITFEIQVSKLVHRFASGDITLVPEVVDRYDIANNTLSNAVIHSNPIEIGKEERDELHKKFEDSEKKNQLQENQIVTLNSTKKELAETLKTTAEKLFMVEDVLNHSAGIIDQWQIERNQTKDLIEWVNEGYNKRKRKGEMTLVQAMEKDSYKKGIMALPMPNFDIPFHSRKRHKPTDAKEIEGVCKVLAKGFELANYSLPYPQTLKIENDKNSK